MCEPSVHNAAGAPGESTEVEGASNSTAGIEQLDWLEQLDREDPIYQPHCLDVRMQKLLWSYALTHALVSPTSAPYGGRAEEVHVCGAK